MGEQQPSTTTTLTGWGRTAPTRSALERPTTTEAIAAAIEAAPARGLIGRGLGRSYGDAAQNAGGTVLDMTSLTRIHRVDEATGEIDVEAGCSLETIVETLLPLGWFLPVTPGTRHVTVGGAIACDVHGKNHHVAGTISAHVASLTLITASGEVRELSAETTPREYWATVGGLGLTGIIARATLKLRRVESAWMRVESERVDGLERMLTRLRETDDRYEHSVAWIDGSARGRRLGRGALIQGDHATSLDALGRPGPRGSSRPRLAVPRGVSVAPLLRGRGARALNELHFRRQRSGSALASIESFFYPLDAVQHWNRLYGRGGFLQYQFAVPLEREDLIERALRQLHACGVEPSLGVLKRFGAASPAPLSFPVAGWTLALDIALPVDVGPTLDSLDEEIATAGGRVYLAKDSRLRGEMVAAMYPSLPEWRRARDELDPDGVFRSDLGRRLGLVEP